MKKPVRPSVLPNKAKRTAKPKPKAQAEYWGITERSLRRWKTEGAPLNDDVAMVNWLGPKPNLKPKTHVRIKTIRAANPGQFPTIDPDWIKWRADVEARKSSGRPSEFQTLEDVRDFWAFKLKLASEAGDKKDAEFATGQLVDIDKAIRDNALAAKKLGIDSGETITRADCMRWFRAWGFWTMRSVDLMLADMVPKVAGLASGITHDLAFRALEPGLLEARLLRPFVLATKITGGTVLPVWIVETVKDTVDDYLKDGAKLFEEFKQ